MTDMTSGYDEFCRFLEQHSGIFLGASKQYLVASRLRRLMAEQGLMSLNELTNRLQLITQVRLKAQVIDAMTTNETLWFRDDHPFQVLEQKLLPEFTDRLASRRLRVWSAACSTGQEPYSIAMILSEYRQQNRFFSAGADILATDISPTALAQARSGEYSTLAIGRGLDPVKLKKHFTELGSGRFKIDPIIAADINFRALNLQDSYALLGRFDLVFCRNVLIYFSADFKRDILTRIHATLNPGGYLLVGASESVHGLSDLYEMVHCRPGILYKKI